MTNLIIDSTVANSVNPSINLAALGVPSNVVVSNTTPGAQPSAFEQLKSLESARISWETVELAQSNNRLYSILKQAYSFYLVMKQDTEKEVRKSKLEAMEAFIADKGYTNSFGATTHDMTRVVKCVFGVDRRRVSAYSIALREALRQEVGADDLVAFLQDNGGVEQIRMGGTKPLSATKRAELVKAEVVSASLGAMQFDASVLPVEPDWIDKQVVFVATCLPNGQFVVNAVIRHDGVVNTALAAHYSQGQVKLRQAESTFRKAQVEIEAEAKRKVRADSAEAKAFIKAHKVPKKALTKEEREAYALRLKQDIAEREETMKRLFEFA